MTGDDGHNAIDGLGGDDALFGGAGNDLLRGGAGADLLEGGEGVDAADYSYSSAGVTVDLLDQVNSGGDAEGDTLVSIEGVQGTDFADRIRGNDSANRLFGNGGDDVVLGEGGDDILSGGAGTDILLGGIGDDIYIVDWGDEAIGIDDYGIETTVNEEHFLAGYDGETAVYGTKTTTTNTLVDGGNDRLHFAGNISPDDLSTRLDGDDIILTINRENEDGELGVDTLVLIRGGLQAESSIESYGFDGWAPVDMTSAVFAIGSSNAVGTTSADSVLGGDGANSIHTGAGNDNVIAGLGNDNISAGDGDDRAWAGYGDDIASGGAGHDLLSGGGGHDILSGDAGDDVIYGGDGNDRIDGGSGDDSLFSGEGNDRLIGGSGADYIFGGFGIDTADYTTSASAVTVNLAGFIGTEGDADGDILFDIENVDGSAFNDVLTGDGGANRLDGGDGDDRLAGLGGADQLIGGAGADTADYTASGTGVNVDLTTGTGTGGDAEGDTLSQIENIDGSAFGDVLTGDGGANRLDGGDGNDRLAGLGGADQLIGGAGIDTADYTASGAGVNVNLTTGMGTGGDAEGDTLSQIENIDGSAFGDVLTGDGGANRLDGGDGNDRLAGLGGADQLIGGAGIDTADYTASGAGVNVNLTTGMGTGGDAEGDTLSQIENIDGSAFGDVLTGDGGANRLDGGDGNDRLAGLGGADQLIGGAGIDTADYTASGAGVNVNLTTGMGTGGDAEGDTLSQIENIDGSAFGDVLTGDGGANRLDGGDGNDRLAGLGGADQLIGGAGIDTADYTASGAGVNVNLTTGMGTGGDAEGDTLSQIENVDGSAFGDVLTGDGGANILLGFAGDDHIDGRRGDDWLDGGEGLDAIFGGTGDDWIIGWTGADELNGGSGIDTADYSGSDAGVIVDLVSGTGKNGHAEGDTLTQIENLVGSEFADSLFGDALANRIDGLDGADEIDGREGNDNLFGNSGDDLIIGGRGNDRISGGDGNDLIDGDLDLPDELVVNGNFDSDGSWILSKGARIHTSGAGLGTRSTNNKALDLKAGSSAVQNIAGAAAGDIIQLVITANIFAANSGKLGEYLSILISGETITTITPIGDMDQYIVEFEVPDGNDFKLELVADGKGRGQGISIEDISMSFVDLAGGADDRIRAGAGDDVVYGNVGSDTISGGSGSDFIDGGASHDIISGGSGNDWLIGASGNDVISGGSGNDIIIGDDLGDNLLVNGNFDAIGPNFTNEIAEGWSFTPDGNSQSGVFGPGRPGSGHTLKFGEKAAITASQTVEDLPVGLDLTISLDVGSLNGKAINNGTEIAIYWNDEEIGRASNISDWQTFEFDINSADGDKSGTISIAYVDGSGKSNNQVLIDNVSISLNTASGAGNDILFGNAGDDWISGGAGNDMISGGLDDDLLKGGDGSDTYEYSLGDGSDVIVETGNSLGIDNLNFSDLNSTDISWSRTGDDLILTIKATGDKITVQDQFASNQHGIENIHFADDQAWDVSQLDISQLDDGRVLITGRYDLYL